MQPTILITGATGHTGLPIVKQLSAEGAPVRAMVHSEEKKSLVKGINVDAVTADFADPVSLERALEGIEKAYLVSPASQDMVQVQSAFVDAAKKSGVKHIVKLSALGTSPDSPVGLLRWHAEVEERLMKSGIGYTLLHPHFFMENLLANAESVKKEKAIYSPLGDVKISTISVQDIAAVAARTLLDAGHDGMTYPLTGPEAISYAQIARILSEVIGRPVKYVPVSFDAVKKGMVQSGMPEWLVDDLIRLMQTWVEGKGNLVNANVQKLTGRKPLSVREFFLKQKSVFMAAA